LSEPSAPIRPPGQLPSAFLPGGFLNRDLELFWEAEIDPRRSTVLEAF
jgi:hypothetical protein